MSQITTIIPTYRRPALLKRAIESVLTQSYRDFEVHVYDNASGDETGETVGKIASRDPRVKYFRHGRNIGLIQNFAFGIERVCTPLFNLLSDDDILLPGFFETASRSLAGAADAMCFVGALIEADQAGRVLRVPFEHWGGTMLAPPEILRQMAGGGTGTWTSMVFRSEVVPQVGNLNPDFGYAADIEFELRLFGAHAAVISQAPCAVFFIHPSSASANQRLPELASALSAIVANLERQAMGQIAPLAVAGLAAWFRDMIFSKARVAAFDGHAEQALAAATVLAQRFRAARHAALIRLIAGESPSGFLARRAFGAGRIVPHLWHRMTQEIRYRHLNALIARAMSQLGSQVDDRPNYQPATSMPA